MSCPGNGWRKFLNEEEGTHWYHHESLGDGIEFLCHGQMLLAQDLTCLTDLLGLKGELSAVEILESLDLFLGRTKFNLDWWLGDKPWLL